MPTGDQAQRRFGARTCPREFNSRKVSQGASQLLSAASVPCVSPPPAVIPRRVRRDAVRGKWKLDATPNKREAHPLSAERRPQGAVDSTIHFPLQ